MRSGEPVRCGLLADPAKPSITGKERCLIGRSDWVRNRRLRQGFTCRPLPANCTTGLPARTRKRHDVTVSSTIAVYRSPDIKVDRNRLYRVVIDDQEVGELWPGQRLSFNVPSGERRVLVKIDFMRSNELALAPEPGDVVELACIGKGSLVAFFNTIFRRKAYLDLHVMTQGERAAWEAAQPQVPKPRNLGSEGAS